MSIKVKLTGWILAGIMVCLMLIPTITEAGGIQLYINIAAFLAIYFGGVAALMLIRFIVGKVRKKADFVWPHVMLGSTQGMVVVMIAFGLYWYDFSEARPHSWGADYQYTLQTPVKLDDGWPVEKLQAKDLDPALIETIVERYVNDEDYKWQHSFLLVKDGKLLVDEYFYDEAVDIPHDLRSANKSITSILIGIAIDKGYINSVKDPVYNYFPEYSAAFETDKAKQAITIEHLLTMQSGLAANDWDRASPGQEDKLYRMKQDWVKTFFNLPLINTPGEVYAYSTAGEMTLRALIVEASKMSLNKFTEDYLFEPLGISHYQWTKTLYGRDDVPVRVELTSRDLAKLGQLYLNKGVWQGKRVVSTDWVTLSTATHTRTNLASMGDPEYGYLWWRHTFDVDGQTIRGYQAQGAGGQFIFVFEQLNTVIVVTSGNYGRRRQVNGLSVVKEQLVPALVKASRR